MESGWVGDLNKTVGRDASGMAIDQRDLNGMMHYLLPTMMMNSDCLVAAEKIMISVDTERDGRAS